MKSTLFFTKSVILTFITIFWKTSVCDAQTQIKQLWGMTTVGGQDSVGTIFKTDSLGNNQSVEHNFVVQNSKAYPYGSLMQASDGKLYGMTHGSGVNGLGVLFQYDPTTSTYTKKLDFAGAINGSSPFGSLMQASDGKLYGMTDLGGTNDMGALFQYDPVTSTITKKLDFVGVNGGNPLGSLMQASDGKLYGMTYGGGINSMGILFQYDPVISYYTKKLDFAGATNGKTPYGSLMQASDGKLYGMTYQGGVNDMGVLFQYDPVTSTYIKKLDFAGVTNGANPLGDLMQASDGKLYGTTYQGGTNNMGVLFQYDPTTSTYIKKLDFVGVANGANPNGTLKQASNGKLYGMTNQGGTNSMGVLYQYDPVTSSYTKKLDFLGINGSYPNSNLIEITVNTVGIFSLKEDVALNLYPNPAHELLTLELLTGNQKSATIIIENMFGQVIYEAQINTSIYQINTEHYARGVYIVKVKSNNETITKKIILE